MSMEAIMSNCRIECEDEKMTRKKNEVDWFSFLPDDVVLDILKRLPDVFLRYKAKHVCRNWFNMITNMILLDHASFILQSSSFGSSRVRHVDIREESQGIEVKEHNLDINYSERILSWHNEFLLILKRKSELYVMNLITKEKSFLPQCQTTCGGHRSSRCVMAFSFKASPKILHLFLGPPIICHILHLESGIKWKKIQVPPSFRFKYHKGEPVSVQVQGRYFHWDVHSSNYLVSVDMLKEEVIQMNLPKSGDQCDYSIFEMGGSLHLIDGISMGKADIWTLVDFQRMKWDKLQSIILPDHFPATSLQYPVCGVISKRYVIFMKSRSGMFSYDMKNGVLKELNLLIHVGDLCLVHSSSPNGVTTLGDFKEKTSNWEGDPPGELTVPQTDTGIDVDYSY